MKKLEIRINGLDSIRLVCALFVLIAHASTVFQDKSLLLNKILFCIFNGQAAVMVFFVISGFCIHYPVASGRKSGWIFYYFRRYIRIGVPLFVAIFLAKVIHLKYTIFQAGILWSLIAELIYYSLYPFFLIIATRIGWKKFIVVSYFISWIVAITHPLAFTIHAYGDQITWILTLPCWLLGCLLAESKELDKVPANIWVLRLTIWGTSSLLLILNFHSFLRNAFTLPLFSLIVFYWLRREIKYFSIHHPLKVLEWAGSWSYSIYLMHMPAIKFMQDFIQDAYGSKILSTILILIFFSLLASYIFFLIVEKPSLWLIKTVKNELFKKKLKVNDKKTYC